MILQFLKRWIFKLSFQQEFRSSWSNHPVMKRDGKQSPRFMIQNPSPCSWFCQSVDEEVDLYPSVGCLFLPSTRLSLKGLDGSGSSFLNGLFFRHPPRHFPWEMRKRRWRGVLPFEKLSQEFILCCRFCDSPSPEHSRTRLTEWIRKINWTWTVQNSSHQTEIHFNMISLREIFSFIQMILSWWFSIQNVFRSFSMDECTNDWLTESMSLAVNKFPFPSNLNMTESSCDPWWWCLMWTIWRKIWLKDGAYSIPAILSLSLLRESDSPE